MEFGTYIDTDPRTGREYADERKRYYDKLRKNEQFMNAKLVHCSYTNWLGVKNALFYMDPPYADTVKYGKMVFDSDKFWEDMRKLSVNNWVFISEYKAPSDFKCISKVSKMVGFVGATDRTRIEKVFIHKSRYEEFKRLGIRIKNDLKD